MAINLLPIELAPKGSAVKIAVYLKNTVTILSVILILFTMVLVTVFTINYIQLRSLSVTTTELKGKISELETTEQKYFLVKDRLKYAMEILNGPSAQAQHKKMSNVLAGMPSDVLLKDARVGADKFSLNLETPNSISLATFMSGIITNPDFNGIDLTSFEFSGIKGFSLSLDFY